VVPVNFAQWVWGMLEGFKWSSIGSKDVQQVSLIYMLCEERNNSLNQKQEISLQYHAIKPPAVVHWALDRARMTSILAF
jgi:hypothetical protein